MAIDTPERFVVALAYCLAYDRTGQHPDRDILSRLWNDRTPQTDEERLCLQTINLADLVLQDTASSATERTEHLRHIQEQAASLGNPQVALIMGGATKIKQYVFESAKLPEIRGASALLDRINLVDLPALFSLPSASDKEPYERAYEVRKRWSARHHVSPLDCPECVIYASGGELLAFAPTTLAQLLTSEIEWLYTTETLVANSVAVWRSFSLLEVAGGVAPFAFSKLWEHADRRRILTELFGHRVADRLPEKKRFGELATALAGEKFRRREGNPDREQHGTVTRPIKPAPQWETMAYGQRCRSCERRLASRSYPLDGEPQLICEACERKLSQGWEWKRTWLTRFEDFLRQTSQEDTYYRVFHDNVDKDVRLECASGRKWDNEPLPDRPRDLNEIAQASEPSGYIGVVYADGNNMGALLETLRSPDVYRQFATAVSETMQEEVFAALTALPPKRVRRVNRQEVTAAWMYPFEILSIGGDDLFLIVPASKALGLAMQMVEGAERRLAHADLFKEDRPYDPQEVHRCVLDGHEPLMPQSAIGISVGVLLADAKTPIFFLQELVGQLLKSAKGRAKWLKQTYQYYGGTIDFMALKTVTMITSSIGEFRDNTLRIDQECLTARPYTIPEMQQLIDTIRRLKTTDFPRSQLYALRQALLQGRLASTIDYLYFTERLREQERNRIRQILDQRWCQEGTAPWRRVAAQGGWETILFDLIELYDFVERSET